MDIFWLSPIFIRVIYKSKHVIYIRDCYPGHQVYMNVRLRRPGFKGLKTNGISLAMIKALEYRAL